MDDNLILDAAERYFNGELNPDEKIYFEELRRNKPEVDLMVVESEAFSALRSRRAEYSRLSMALREFPFPKDILIYSQAEFDFWKDSPNHVVGRARREGKILHEGH